MKTKYAIGVVKGGFVLRFVRADADPNSPRVTGMDYGDIDEAKQFEDAGAVLYEVHRWEKLDPGADFVPYKQVMRPDWEPCRLK